MEKHDAALSRFRFQGRGVYIHILYEADFAAVREADDNIGAEGDLPFGGQTVVKI